MKSTTIQDSILTIRQRLQQLDSEQHKLRAALAALNAVDHGEVVARKRGNGTELAVAVPKRTYSYAFTAKCARCGKDFKTARVVKKDSPKRKNQYCHNPCTSEMHRREIGIAAQQAEAKHTETKLRSTTLIKGDSLTARH